MASRFVKITLIGLGFFVVAGLSAYLTLTFIVKGEETVVVPDIAGKDVVSVLQLLTDLGLNTKVKGSEYSADVPANHVIFQEPRPGVEIKKDRDVRIIISKGAKTVVAPKLKGLSIQQARIIIAENGLCLGNQSRVFDGNFRREEIISQTPSPGSNIERGRCVDLLLSLGGRPAAYKMPDLMGRPIEDVFLLMDAVGFRLGNIQAVFLKNKPFDMVVGQIPPAGHQILEGSRVNLKVNKPPDDDGQRIVGGFSGVGLFRYRLGHGFLKRHIRIRLNGFGTSHVLFDDMVGPGEEIWHLIPNIRDAAVLLYEDGELINTAGVRGWNRNQSAPDDFRFTLSGDRFPSLAEIRE